MKFIKNNFKIIIAFIIGVVLAGGIVYATTSAGEIEYTVEGRTDISTVSDALNDLYSKVPNGTKTIEENGTFDVKEYENVAVNVEKKAIFVNAYSGAANVENKKSASLTISGLTADKQYFMIIGRSNTGGSNAYFYQGNGITITSANYESVGDYTYNVTPTESSITITIAAYNTQQTNGSRVYAWVFEGTL